MKQVEILFENDADKPTQTLLMSDEQKQQLTILMAEAISVVMQIRTGDDDV